MASEVELDSIHASECVTHGVRINAAPCYLPKHSSPREGRYIFGYAVRIANESGAPVRLIERHWFIRDAEGETNEVQGEGVVGVQPSIEPGAAHEYASFCPLGTQWGTMEGSFLMVREDGSAFDAEIKRFYLVADADEADGLTVDDEIAHDESL